MPVIPRVLNLIRKILNLMPLVAGLVCGATAGAAASHCEHHALSGVRGWSGSEPGLTGVGVQFAAVIVGYAGLAWRPDLTGGDLYGSVAFCRQL